MQTEPRPVLDVSPPPAGGIGAEIRGVDVLELGPEEFAEVRDLVYRHKLVVFRDQDPSTAEYVVFAQRLGEPQIYFQENYHHPNFPEVCVSSNELRDGEKFGVAGTGRYWHTDCQFFEMPPPLTVLYPRRLPDSKSETYYVDLQRVYERLPDDLRAFVDSGVRARHEAKWRYMVQARDIDRSMAEILAEVGELTPTVTHPAVIEHPVTHARSLYVSEGYTVGFEGLPHEESQERLRALFEFIDRPENIHRHTWGASDILLWDNRPLIHMASTVPPGQKMTSYRIGVYDGHPFYVGQVGDRRANQEGMQR